MTEYAAVQSLAGKGKMILADALPTEPRAEILMSAAACVLSDRNQAYGMPEDNFANISSLWNAYLEMRKQRLLVDGQPACVDGLDGADQAVMMALMKIARLATNPTHKDSWIDAVGYLACGWRCVAAEMGLPLKTTLADLAQGVSPAPVPFLDTLRSVAPAWAEGLGDEYPVEFPGEGCPCEVCTCHDDPEEPVPAETEEPFDYCDIAGESAPEGISQRRWITHLRDLERYPEFGDDVQRRNWWTTPWGEWDADHRGSEVTYPLACRLLRHEAHIRATRG